MLQAAKILLEKYPEEFSIESLAIHIDDLLERFQNKALGDIIYRVGCDLPRKLGANDRLSGAIRLAVELKLPYDLILKALVCGCQFRATGQNGERFPNDIEFDKVYKMGISNVLKSICGFHENEDHQIFEDARKLEKELYIYY